MDEQIQTIIDNRERESLGLQVENCTKVLTACATFQHPFSSKKILQDKEGYFLHRKCQISAFFPGHNKNIISVTFFFFLISPQSYQGIKLVELVDGVCWGYVFFPISTQSYQGIKLVELVDGVNHQTYIGSAKVVFSSQIDGILPFPVGLETQVRHCRYGYNIVMWNKNHIPEWNVSEHPRIM
ncbi:hypothetical protein LAZ67_1002265 [Cordylochernes scorpioides]|uniref:Uncharacterized protein n=1 Tax=Cordylochernes scorpioides TaxID=51811 RepID=A0ABY6JX34_9ARAC|nr:hypothetical protein LAZ67_1002265 [Cordylochernes scorpioides]